MVGSNGSASVGETGGASPRRRLGSTKKWCSHAERSAGVNELTSSGRARSVEKRCFFILIKTKAPPKKKKERKQTRHFGSRPARGVSRSPSGAGPLTRPPSAAILRRPAPPPRRNR